MISELLVGQDLKQTMMHREKPIPKMCTMSAAICDLP